MLRQAVVSQRAIVTGRAHQGEFQVDGATVTVDDGRVLDIVIDGRSWADQLPVVFDGDAAGTPPTLARAQEATLVAELLARTAVQAPAVQPGCEILDT